MGPAGRPALLTRGALRTIPKGTTVPVHGNYNPRIANVDSTYGRKGTPTEPGGHSRPCECLSLWREVASLSLPGSLVEAVEYML